MCGQEALFCIAYSNTVYCIKTDPHEMLAYCVFYLPFLQPEDTFYRDAFHLWKLNFYVLSVFGQ